MNISVANLSRETTEDSLRYAFSAFGQVRLISITKDETTGEAGAFVSMPIESEAQTAISRMNGKDLDGQTVQVEKSRLKPNILNHTDKRPDAKKDHRGGGKRSGAKRGGAKRGGAKSGGAKRGGAKRGGAKRGGTKRGGAKRGGTNRDRRG